MLPTRTLAATVLVVAWGLGKMAAAVEARVAPQQMNAIDKQVTRGPGGRILTNTGVWSPDSQWIVFDTRSDPAGETFDGERICVVNVETGEVRTVYQSKNGARCGVATFNPREAKVAFILGPENPKPDWQYNAFHRQGVVVEVAHPGVAVNLDARDLTPPFTPGALRGGSHVHVWDASGEWVSFTYEDHVLAQFPGATERNDVNQRNIGVSVPGRPVRVPKDHPRNHDGEYFTVLVSRTTPRPRPGSDDIIRACEEGWVGTNGYARADGSRQRHALAFQGTVLGTDGKPFPEVFLVDLPEDLTVPGDGPLAGTSERMPSPPKGCVQRRLTFTQGRKFQGVQGPRHWLRCSPDGAQVAFLMKDDDGLAQIWTVAPTGGSPKQLTRNPWPVDSTFTWSPDGARIAYVAGQRVCVTEALTGQTTALTAPGGPEDGPRPEACVFSPDGRRIAYVRTVAEGNARANQIFVVSLPPRGNS